MGSDDGVFPEDLIQSAIMPLDDAVERMIAVDIETVRKVLAPQGLHVVGETDMKMLEAMKSQDAVWDDPVWLRNEVRRQRVVIKALYEQVQVLRESLR
jgi:hypothetical protein